MLHKLQYISQGKTPQEHVENIHSVLENGGKWIQLRLKNIPDKEYLSLAQQVKKICDEFHAVLIINDNIAVAHQSGANGVHLGLTDSSVMQARKILGNDTIIGGTANTIHDIFQRNAERVDYIGLGPLRFTATKDKLSPELGFEGYKTILEEMRSVNFTIPVFAIGGVLPEDCKPLAACGVYGVAVSSAITNAADKKEMILQFQNNMNVLQTL
ncbi:MAG: thiamine phosphate synthase [Bacteroidota bacterium]